MIVENYVSWKMKYEEDRQRMAGQRWMAGSDMRMFNVSVRVL